MKPRNVAFLLPLALASCIVMMPAPAKSTRPITIPKPIIKAPLIGDAKLVSVDRIPSRGTLVETHVLQDGSCIRIVTSEAGSINQWDVYLPC